MLNIVIPMAGSGSRFSSAGYTDPKPLIKINGKPMIQIVVENLTPRRPHRFVFICQNQHIHDYDLKEKLHSYAEHVEIIGIDGITQGQACTALEAQAFIDNDNPLMMANSDQYVDADIDQYLTHMEREDLDGLIMTMQANDPKWSYVRCNEQGYAVETAEKRVISQEAAVGIFNFRHGRDFVRSAKLMLQDDSARTNGEFYTCPCYNYLIREGKKIGTYSVGQEYNGMHGLGIPSDLHLFLKHPVSEKVR